MGFSVAKLKNWYLSRLQALQRVDMRKKWVKNRRWSTNYSHLAKSDSEVDMNVIIFSFDSKEFRIKLTKFNLGSNYLTNCSDRLKLLFIQFSKSNNTFFFKFSTDFLWWQRVRILMRMFFLPLRLAVLKVGSGRMAVVVTCISVLNVNSSYQGFSKPLVGSSFEHPVQQSILACELAEIMKNNSKDCLPVL